jgi:membrane dipeptidase
MEKRQSLYRNNCHIDIERLKQYKAYIQMFAVWIDPKYYSHNALKRTLQIIDEFLNQVEKNNKYISFVTNYQQAIETINKGKIAAFLSIEGGEALQGDLSVLRMFYRLGVRSICLTWNGRNEIADGVEEECTQGGLTKFGIEVVKEMNRLGMLIDVSHLAPRGFWDVIATSEKPIIASHSNSRVLCNNRRNLTDEQFEAIVRGRGLVGINLYTNFLNNNADANINDIVKHIEHFMALGGENSIGLGTDFDGIDKTPVGINGVEDLEKVFNLLLRLNYSQEQVEKIAGKNYLRLISEIL